MSGPVARVVAELPPARAEWWKDGWRWLAHVAAGRPERRAVLGTSIVVVPTICGRSIGLGGRSGSIELGASSMFYRRCGSCVRVARARGIDLGPEATS